MNKGCCFSQQPFYYVQRIPNLVKRINSPLAVLRNSSVDARKLWTGNATSCPFCFAHTMLRSGAGLPKRMLSKMASVLLRNSRKTGNRQQGSTSTFSRLYSSALRSRTQESKPYCRTSVPISSSASGGATPDP